MKLIKKACSFLAVAALSTSALAADITKKEAEDYFWKVVETIQTEDPAYFKLFDENAKISYNVPKSWEMENGDVSMKDFKETQEGLWMATENHSFDLENPEVAVDGDTATVSTTFYERYTIQGYTSSSENKQVYTIEKDGDELSIVAFQNDVTDLTDQQYQQKSKEAENNKQ